MSLPACQQRALDQIEKALMSGDPRLGSLFAIFSRLTRHEAIPGTEQVKPRKWQALQALAGTLRRTRQIAHTGLRYQPQTGTPPRVRRHFASKNDRIPKAISPSATRMSSHGPKGDWANERSTPSAPLALAAS
jgi:hypothetical protein